MRTGLGVQHRRGDRCHQRAAALVIELTFGHRGDEPVAGRGRWLAGDEDRHRPMQEDPGNRADRRAGGISALFVEQAQAWFDSIWATISRPHPTP